ncbi:hydrophobin-like protein [Heterobasidion irregulare TC 32-1]|uniref:Hydrophobin n=1 Tax=Heterobasidion irregulare (strain TC 32-1) TaxID=747525 RepID=W4JU53_HETIT|nr:hydrophobin-like protein [Heterobasidion irregulare TC 32-1]ETW76620.1 hydrophobin-like protein [Heterobasidion irregulare TC 32-1]
MFHRITLSILYLLFISLFASATPVTRWKGQCDAGPVQCCNSVQKSSNPSVAKILSGIAVPLQGLSVPIGLTCSPLNLLALGGNSCASQPVCCENNNFNGLVAIGCTPIDLGAL